MVKYIKGMGEVLKRYLMSGGNFKRKAFKKTKLLFLIKKKERKQKTEKVIFRSMLNLTPNLKH